MQNQNRFNNKVSGLNVNNLKYNHWDLFSSTDKVYVVFKYITIICKLSICMS